MVTRSDVDSTNEICSNGDCQEFVWHLDPSLPVLRRSLCEGPMKILYDKAKRVRQLSSHCSGQNACSLRYATHWREWLFIKCCPNCLINNVRIHGIDLASLFGVQINSLKYLRIAESEIVPEIRTATNCASVIGAGNLCLSRKRQIER
jgi:hypothetical protein